MAIFRNGKEVTAVYLGERVISAVYHGAQLVWQAVRSCFGSGRWFGKKRWLGKERWRY